MTANYQTPMMAAYSAIDRAFTHFNAELFDHRLPDIFFTIHRKRGAHGYFWAEQFKHRDTGEQLDEIALNPETMGRTPKEVLSTLAHEMVHLEQQHYGKPGKNGHHNKEWGDMMDRIGLTPTSTGAEGGKRTGRKVTHMIVEGGPFDVACDTLIDSGLDLAWFTEARVAAKKKDLSKVKHSCGCGTNIWGKQGIMVRCDDCDELFTEVQG